MTSKGSLVGLTNYICALSNFWYWYGAYITWYILVTQLDILWALSLHITAHFQSPSILEQYMFHMHEFFYTLAAGSSNLFCTCIASCCCSSFTSYFLQWAPASNTASTSISPVVCTSAPGCTALATMYLFPSVNSTDDIQEDREQETTWWRDGGGGGAKTQRRL